jgi:hypothetical protein
MQGITKDLGRKAVTINSKPWPFTLKEVATNTSEVKSTINSVVDRIMEGCNVLARICDKVLQDLGDDPKYFETYQGSITDYTAQYGVKPFQPISSLTYILRGNTIVNVNDFLPVHSMGSTEFKFQYGTRLLLGRPEIKPLIDHNPGFADLVGTYNIMVDTRSQVEKSRVESYAGALTRLARYVFDARYIKPVISTDLGQETDGAIAPHGGLLVNAHITVNTGTDASKNTTTHQQDKELLEVVQLTESGDRDESIKKIVSSVTGDKQSQADKIIQNIVDLNIIPINVHALMREIPLANLFNYSYTFDRLIVQVLYGNTKFADKIVKEQCSNTMEIRSYKDMLAKLLIDPHVQISPDMTGPFFAKMLGGVMRGEIGNGWGRPKFLSDQLMPKVFYRGVYDSADYSDAGPNAGINILAALTAAIRNAARAICGRADARHVELAIHGASVSEILNAYKVAGTSDATDLLAAIFIYCAVRIFAPHFRDTSLSADKINRLNAVLQSNLPAAKANHNFTDTDADGYNLGTATTNLKSLFNGSLKEELAAQAGDIVGVYHVIVPNCTFAHGKDARDFVINNRVIAGEAGRVRSIKTISVPEHPTIHADLKEETDNIFDPAQIKTYTVPNNADGRRNIGLISIARMNTVLARNLIFITNMYRAVRAKLKSDLIYTRDIVAKSVPITNDRLTEFYGNEVEGAPKDWANPRYT